MVLPWLTPWAGGPSATVQPWLLSLFCATVLFGAARHVGSLHRGLLAGFLLLAFWAALGQGGLHPEGLAAVAAMVLMLLCASVGAAWAKDDTGVRLIAGALLVAALANAITGLCQYFGAAAQGAPWMNPGAVGEAVGNLRQRNQLATLTALGLAALFWLVPRAAAAPASARAWGCAAAALLAVANAASASRIGLVQLLVLSVLALLWAGPARSGRLLLSGVAVASYCASALILPLLLQHWHGIEASSVFDRLAVNLGCASRRVLWSNVLELIAARPFAGWGWGELDYAHYATLYNGVRFCDILDNAHNLPLHLAVELGLPAAVLACGAGAWLVLRAFPWTEKHASRQLGWAIFVVIGLHSLVEYPLWYGPFQMTMGLALGVLWPGAAGTSARHTLRMVLATLGCAAVLYAGWDYRRASQAYLPPAERLPAYALEPVSKAAGSWFFASQVRFADLSLTALTRDNAERINRQAQQLLHYSPEPRVIEKLIESALVLGHEQEMQWHMARYRAAFPADYAAWLAAGRKPPTGAQGLRD